MLQTTDDFFEAYKGVLDEFKESPLYDNNTGPHHYASFAYDAVWTMAKALHEADENLGSVCRQILLSRNYLSALSCVIHVCTYVYVHVTSANASFKCTVCTCTCTCTSTVGYVAMDSYWGCYLSLTGTLVSPCSTLHIAMNIWLQRISLNRWVTQTSLVSLWVVPHMYMYIPYSLLYMCICI